MVGRYLFTSLFMVANVAKIWVILDPNGRILDAGSLERSYRGAARVRW